MNGAVRAKGTGKAHAAWLALALAPANWAQAHGGDAAAPATWWRTWELEPAVIASLFLAVALYFSGLRALRHATGAAKKLRRETGYFIAGWTVAAAALVSPIHPLSAVLFSVHMTQHELLMVVAAPLLVLGRPAIVLLWALPRGAARRLVRMARSCGGGTLWRWGTNVFIASLLHASALWIWHVPALFQATLVSDAVHAAQHAAFLGTALLFWEAVWFGPQRAAGFGLAVLYLFLTAVHSGALGALLTFASTVWYPAYQDGAARWGLTALEDQQLGGLIMWIPAGVIYLVAGLWLFAAWLRESDRPRRPQPLGGDSPCVPAP